MGFEADQNTAENFAQQDREERAHLDQAVAADEFFLFEMLRQDGVLHWAEQCRMGAHHEQRHE